MNWPFQTLGKSTHPPLCFLHGFLGAGKDWERVATTLAERFYCILPDLPGHGANTHLDVDAPLSFETLNEGLLTLLNTLDLQKTHLVGYSMGGRAALFFAVHHPARVLSLTLESASPGITDPVERRTRAGEDDARANAIRVDGVEAFVDHWYTLPLFRSLNAYPAVRAEIIARRKHNDPAWVVKAISALSPGRQPPVWDQVSDLDLPVLLVTGALDEKYVALGNQMAARMPHARLEVVPAAGHTVHAEQPEQFFCVLENFLTV